MMEDISQLGDVPKTDPLEKILDEIDPHLNRKLFEHYKEDAVSKGFKPNAFYDEEDTEALMKAQVRSLGFAKYLADNNYVLWNNVAFGVYDVSIKKDNKVLRDRTIVRGFEYFEPNHRNVTQNLVSEVHDYLKNSDIEFTASEESPSIFFKNHKYQIEVRPLYRGRYSFNNNKIEINQQGVEKLSEEKASGTKIWHKNAIPKNFKNWIESEVPEYNELRGFQLALKPKFS